MTLDDVLDLRDRVALLDGVEDPDSDAGCAAAEVLAVHNAIVTGELAPEVAWMPDDAA